MSELASQPPTPVNPMRNPAASPPADAAASSAAAPNPDEVKAARVALYGNVAERIWIGLRALHRLLQNPNDTKQVFVLGIALNAHRFPGFVARFASDPSGAALLRERPTIDSRSVDFAALAQLPPDTLGGAFARHMKENQLDPDLFQAPPGLPDEAAYIAKRVRQTHDVWHLLTGYKTDIPGELALQAFYYGLIEMPSALFITVFGTLRYARHFPSRNLFRMVHEGYRRGKQAAFLPTIKWEDLWTLPLDEVRRRVNIAISSAQCPAPSAPSVA